MRLKIIIAATITLLSGCTAKAPNPKLVELTSQQVSDARTAANDVTGSRGEALFICGQADGLGIFTAKWDDGFSADGMKDGRLVFVIRDDGRPDLFFRDATGAYFSTINDGGTVQRISEPSQEIESWVITYKSTGITETHNLTKTNDGKLVDLWTSNKPTSVIGASAKLFRSSCVRS